MIIVKCRYKNNGLARVKEVLKVIEYNGDYK